MEFQTEHHHQNKYLSLFVLRNTWQLILSKVTVFQLLFLRNEFARIEGRHAAPSVNVG